MGTEIEEYAKFILTGEEASIRPIGEWLKKNMNQDKKVKLSEFCRMSMEECKKYCEYYYDDYCLLVKEIHPDVIALDFDFFYKNIDFIGVCSMLRNSLNKDIYVAGINEITYLECYQIVTGQEFEVFDPEKRIFDKDKFVVMYGEGKTDFKDYDGTENPMCFSDLFNTDEELQKIINSYEAKYKGHYEQEIGDVTRLDSTDLKKI